MIPYANLIAPIISRGMLIKGGIAAVKVIKPALVIGPRVTMSPVSCAHVLLPVA